MQILPWLRKSVSRFGNGSKQTTKCLESIWPWTNICPANWAKSKRSATGCGGVWTFGTTTDSWSHRFPLKRTIWKWSVLTTSIRHGQSTSTSSPSPWLLSQQQKSSVSTAKCRRRFWSVRRARKLCRRSPTNLSTSVKFARRRKLPSRRALLKPRLDRRRRS